MRDWGSGLSEWGPVMVIGSIVVICIVAGAIVLWVMHYLSYGLAKHRVLKRQAWGLNICCGATDGGGVNADIVQHIDLPNFEKIDDVTHLPFVNGQFKTVLCSHTIEHVDDPSAMFAELQRVGNQVTFVLPPLWDVAAVLNIFEHRWVFLTFRKEHTDRLPRHVALPFAQWVQHRIGQRIKA